MFNILRLFILFILLLPGNMDAQKVEKIDNDQFFDLLDLKEDKLFIMNFWATWCSPCVTELPDFIKVSDELSDKDIEFIFINLDFPSQYESRLLPFMEKYNFKDKVYTLSEVNYNEWIPQVEEEWSGEIPSTLFFNNARNIYHFHSDAMNADELRLTINNLLSEINHK